MFERLDNIYIVVYLKTQSIFKSYRQVNGSRRDIEFKIKINNLYNIYKTYVHYMRMEME